MVAAFPDPTVLDDRQHWAEYERASLAGIIDLDTGLLAPAASASATALSNSTEIATASVETARVTMTADRTDIRLAAGTVNNQQLIIRNESAYAAIFAAEATSRVKWGTIRSIVPYGRHIFRWSTADSRWHEVGVPGPILMQVDFVGTAHDGSTDDSLNIKRAIDAAVARGFSGVQFGPFAYSVATSVHTPVVHADSHMIGIPSNFVIQGAGNGATKLICPTDFTSVFFSLDTVNITIRDLEVESTAPGDHRLDYCKIIRCTGGRIENVKGRKGSYGFSLHACVDFVVDGCTAYSPWRTGGGKGFALVDLGDHPTYGELSGSRGVRFVNCRVYDEDQFQDANYGFHFNADATAINAAYDIQVVNCHADSLTRGGFWVHGMQVQLDNCSARNCGSYGFMIAKTDYSTFTNLRAEGNGLFGIAVGNADLTPDTFVTHSTFTGCIALDNGDGVSAEAAGFYLYCATDCVFTGGISGNLGAGTVQKYGIRERTDLGTAGNFYGSIDLRNNATGAAFLSTTSRITAMCPGLGPANNSGGNISDGSTITGNAQGQVKVQLATAGAKTGIIMATGTYDGEVQRLMNQSGSGSMTFAAAATSNMAAGTGAVIPALGGITIVWNAVYGGGAGRWVIVG